MSSDITLRLEKGTDLSYEEGDENFTHIRRLYRFTEDSVTSGGSGNNYTITSINTPQNTFEPNMIFGFIASFTNSTTDPTMAIDSLDSKIIKRSNGDTVEAGEIEDGSFYLIRYNNSTDTYRLIESSVLIQEIQALEADNSSQDDELSDIRTTQGTSLGDTNLGSFSGSTIPNGSSVKGALQSLETFSEENESDINDNASAISALQALGISASAGSTGSITIPYSSSNAIVINWGSIFAPNDNTVTAIYDQPLTAVFQGVVTNRTTGSSNDAVNCVPGTSDIDIRNNAGSTTAMYIVIGRLSI